MNVIVIGCGKVGRTIVNNLVKEDNDITVIDINPDVIDSVVNEVDVAGIAGNAANHEILLEAGVKNADIVISVTKSDEFNVLCCLLAKKTGGCQTIARVRNPEYNNELNFIKDELGLAMLINPEMASAVEISRILRFPSAISVDTFAKGRVELLQLKIPEGSFLDGMKIRDIRPKAKNDVLVCGVERGEEIFIPNGEFVLRTGDSITIVSSPMYVNDFFRKVGVRANQAKSVIIAGGGETGFYLASILTKTGVDVTIIEHDEKRCNEINERLAKVKVIHGDATDRVLLDEEGIGSVDAFCALTSFDEENVMLSLYAKKASPNIKTITKINKIEFDDIIKEMDLDTIVYPKEVAAEHVTSFVRAMKNSMGSNVETMYRVIGGKAEALEFIVKEGSPVVDKPLMELNLKSDIIVACITRKGKIIYPRGTDTMQVGDSVVIVTTREGLDDIKDILV
ncbi:MAG: Trk system potassium transporter TrkA [Lachnospiraceae bacterium]|nr:Trk system potassium transporter TrkA [Lachnospiraceae bacterium]